MFIKRLILILVRKGVLKRLKNPKEFADDFIKLIKRDLDPFNATKNITKELKTTKNKLISKLKAIKNGAEFEFKIKLNTEIIDKLADNLEIIQNTKLLESSWILYGTYISKTDNRGKVLILTKKGELIDTNTPISRAKWDAISESTQAGKLVNQYTNRGKWKVLI